MVLSYVRWVMVRKRDAASPAPEAQVPDLAKALMHPTLGKAVPPLDRPNGMLRCQAQIFLGRL
jgi:2-methylfumaryl-CoA hydratase